jgi:rhodanese-related sulfurtransferase
MFLFKRSAEEYDDLTIADYLEQFTDTDTFTLVDVRTTGEFAQGRLPNAINIPLDQLSRKISQIPMDKPVVVVCQTGSRSRTGASIIARAGCETVYNLKGGTMSWMLHGHPIER